MGNMFSFFRGSRQQPLQFADGYNRNSLDFSRPLSSFGGGYNQQMQPLESATQQPTGGYMPFNPTPAPEMESAKQLAPSLLSSVMQKVMKSDPVALAGAQSAQAKAEQMSAQGSPMLSQVQQMGGRYQRRFSGLLG